MRLICNNPIRWIRATNIATLAMSRITTDHALMNGTLPDPFLSTPASAATA
jgi:hypothetical protein